MENWTVYAALFLLAVLIVLIGTAHLELERDLSRILAAERDDQASLDTLRELAEAGRSAQDLLLTRCAELSKELADCRGTVDALRAQCAAADEIEAVSRRLEAIGKVLEDRAAGNGSREADMSAAVQEGIENLMRYAAGRVPGVEASVR